jgi:DIS3-like exonuclease 1
MRERHDVTRFAKHLSLNQLESGVKSDVYISGVISVSKFRPRTEAIVKAGKTQGDNVSRFCVSCVHYMLQLESARDVLIIGSEDRNRAVHGDMVVVQLLPEDKWRARDRTIVTSADQDRADDGPCMPTGFVCVLLITSWTYLLGCRHSAAAMARLCGQHHHGGCRVSLEQGSAGPRLDGAPDCYQVVVVPMDVRIPRIRISASNKEHIKVLKDDFFTVDITSSELSYRRPH